MWCFVIYKIIFQLKGVTCLAQKKHIAHNICHQYQHDLSIFHLPELKKKKATNLVFPLHERNSHVFEEVKYTSLFMLFMMTCISVVFLNTYFHCQCQIPVHNMYTSTFVCIHILFYLYFNFISTLLFTLLQHFIAFKPARMLEFCMKNPSGMKISLNNSAKTPKMHCFTFYNSLNSERVNEGVISDIVLHSTNMVTGLIHSLLEQVHSLDN